MKADKEFDSIMIKAMSNNPENLFSAIQSVRIRLSSSPGDKSATIDSAITSGLVPILVCCLETTNPPALQFEAAWAITNISSGSSVYVQNVVDAEAVPSLIKLVQQTTYSKVCEQALWALANIISDGPVIRDHAVKSGVVKPVLNLLQPNTPTSILRIVSRVIRSLFHSKSPPDEKSVAEVVPALKTLFHCTDIDVLSNAVCSLASLTDAGGKCVDVLYTSGVVPDLVPLLSHEEVKIQCLILKLLSDIASGTYEQTQLILDCDALSHFHYLLNHHKEVIRQESLFFLSNVTAGSESQVEAVIKAKLIPSVIRNLSRGVLRTRKEAVWVITNLTEKGNSDQVICVINEGFIRPFCDLLDFHDPPLVEKVLIGISNSLKAAGPYVDVLVDIVVTSGGLEKMQNLLSRGDFAFAKQAQDIIEQYFCPTHFCPPGLC